MHAWGLVVCVVIVFVDVADVIIVAADAIIIVVAGLSIAVCPCTACRLLNMKIMRATGSSHRWEDNGADIILS